MQRDSRVQKLLEQIKKQQAIKREQEAVTQQGIVAAPQTFKPATQLQQAPAMSADISGAQDALQKSMMAGSSLSGAMAGTIGAMQMANARADEALKNKYLQQAMLSGDPAAIYMAGGKEFAAALMQKEAQEKANLMRAQQHKDTLDHQRAMESLQAIGMDENRYLHDLQTKKLELQSSKEAANLIKKEQKEETQKREAAEKALAQSIRSITDKLPPSERQRARDIGFKKGLAELEANVTENTNIFGKTKKNPLKLNEGKREIIMGEKIAQ
ncbi:hypothetical protein FACS189496_2190 [Bacilli bacterium]|nr:hypothetical protein FACS189496_2190 [Bacilli bacterium]